ncbi:hypothetical protein PACTADRAFT_1035 [Pachysolen tannophilus NRRL Y-2460]|uniref:Type 2A phosphatase-associated protein 42 n=1 Tax=Pachysolen tannophilus NRRL Y-2460 TaxID=669874 RepID=A0A1E4U3H9_PACTA|nr:hypothetical protein PACTADRAFT_1035 [Pachysolen tannophilus NRRL Y-2460]
MSEGSKQLSLSQKFDSIVNESVKLVNDSSIRKDSDEYESKSTEMVEKLIGLKNKIRQLSLFSDNEDLEEISTGDLKYLSIDYHLAVFLENNGNGIEDRMKKLKLSRNLYLQFLYNLENYNILNKTQKSKLDNFKSSYEPKLSELKSNDPVLLRKEKLDNFKLEKELNEKLKILNSGNFLESLDDEVIRSIYVDQAKFFSLNAFKSLELITMELDLLSNAPPPQQPKIEELNSLDKKDIREKPSSKNDFLYTDKLETLTSPLLSKTGKILKPFVLVSDRNKIAQKTFGTGQVLPSMSVEEYLEQELQNGGMVQNSNSQGNNQQENDDEEDEDNPLVADRETYKAREWDEFKETHAKGSGNTINRG